MTELSAHQLVQTRDCTTVGCPYEADAEDGLCRHCRARTARPRPAWSPTEGLRQLARDLERKPKTKEEPVLTASTLDAAVDEWKRDETARKETSVRTCEEVAGCTAPTISDRGRYARVCADHKHLVTARYQQAKDQPPILPAPTPEPEPTPEPDEAPPVDEIVQLAQHVAECSRRAQVAYAEWEQAKQAHQDAVDAARQALDREGRLPRG